MKCTKQHVSLALLLTLTISTQAHVREDFHKAMGSEERLVKFLKHQVNQTDEVHKAYNALATCMMAEYQFWPADKWRSFTKGRDQLETCLLSDPTNPELRYIRLLIQLNVPGIVNYSSDVTNDINVFASNIVDYPTSLYWKKTFITRLTQCKNITDNQKTQLLTLKENLS
jgi:hypothetical protein